MSASDVFQTLVSRIDYPMFIVTASNGTSKAGCLVGFATQASIDPPRMMVMISKKNHTYRVASTSRELVVHFLGADNVELAKLFGEETGDEIDKFSTVEWTPTPSGVPVLRGTLGWVSCRVLERIDSGDHVGHLVEPVDGEVGNGHDGDIDEHYGQLGYQDVTSFNPGHSA